MLLQAVFPNVMAPDVLEGLRAMTAAVFEAVDVPEKMRYQGSSINVLTPQAWEAAGGGATPWELDGLGRSTASWGSRPPRRTRLKPRWLEPK